MINLYADGGVILKNPSPIGGTWAWCVVDAHGELLAHDMGVITPSGMGTEMVTNNQTELLALIHGLHSLNTPNIAHVYSDSKVSLGRLFKGSPFNGIPDWMIESLRVEKKRLRNFYQFSYTHLDGHPTKQQLRDGIGKHGNPVSKWNKLCDDLCKAEALRYTRENPRILSTFRKSEKLKISL